MRRNVGSTCLAFLAFGALTSHANAKQYKLPQDPKTPVAVVRVNVKNDSAAQAWKRYFYVAVSDPDECAKEKATGRTLTWVNLKILKEHTGEPVKIEAEKEHVLTFQYIDTKLGWTRICTVSGSISPGSGSDVTAEFQIDTPVSTCDVTVSPSGSAMLPAGKFRKLPVVCNTAADPVPSGVGQINEPVRVKVITY
jgi:hypothetical protein